MLVGERLREARIKQNLTQEQLAEQLGISKAAICLYEKEKRNPSLENVIEMIYVLGVSADYLLGTDYVVEIIDAKTPKFSTLTKDEVYFLTELRKDSLLYDILFQNPKRGVDIIKKRIG